MAHSFVEKEFLTVGELAQFTGISISTWNKRRVTGRTPPFTKIGRTVRYRKSDVEVWLSSRSVSSTSVTTLDA
ncbi:helix-turn-helix domain-containing protein [Sphingomonas sp. RB56-2]|uniref:Helix-turn-helix domain-containing protein n=1 Tax=Sphingomonas brevis TaxID=2908206 RepID=A0ABT0SAY0_9SPHN|nr:helix-turn-helix domain-containing protein [Sphingomonas brevis]MCL6741570.1 helix-turn-helix domain-containing protein [Sphingomonas brevis]